MEPRLTEENRLLLISQPKSNIFIKLSIPEIYRIIKNSFLYKYTNFINITVQIENLFNFIKKKKFIIKISCKKYKINKNIFFKINK